MSFWPLCETGPGSSWSPCPVRPPLCLFTVSTRSDGRDGNQRHFPQNHLAILPILRISQRACPITLTSLLLATPVLFTYAHYYFRFAFVSLYLSLFILEPRVLHSTYVWVRARISSRSCSIFFFLIYANKWKISQKKLLNAILVCLWIRILTLILILFLFRIRIRNADADADADAECGVSQCADAF